MCVRIDGIKMGVAYWGRSCGKSCDSKHKYMSLQQFVCTDVPT